jgi:hypothetical protein
VAIANAAVSTSAIQLRNNVGFHYDAKRAERTVTLTAIDQSSVP